MRAAAWAASLALALGCGGRPAPAAPEPIIVDAGPDAAAAPDAPPGDPAMAEVLDALRDFHQRGCACTAAACGEDVEAAQVQWGFEHQELLSRTAPTPAQEAEARQIVEALEACLERWH
ncbi:MAG TPA: hypothetical protein VM734_04370 [Kofleriaceae bacterium]|jgi:hypothetical protein|nr:hypothetical protein [Kofleriaceae bacterium]